MRARHQEGWVEERNGKTKTWYGHYYVYVQNEAGHEDRRHRGVKLGKKCKEFCKWQAEKKLREIIAKASKGVPSGDGVNLTWFTRERFLPMREPQWAPSTRETNLYNIERHILPALGDSPLSEIDKFKCQVFLNSIAKNGFSFTVVDHCRTMLKAILEEAADAESAKIPLASWSILRRENRTNRYSQKNRREN